MNEFTRYADATTALASLYTGRSYGYPTWRAFELASETLSRARTFGYEDDVIAVALGEAKSCDNCPRVAVANRRCAKCAHLPSDDL